MKIERLEPGDARPGFSCGDKDLDEFYSKDSIISSKQLLSVSYIVLDESDSTVAYFSVSNDAIRRDSIEKPSYRRITRKFPHSKRYSSIPAVKIGRLGVASHAQCKKLGTDILDFLKMWFTHKNKTGCRFIVVDAYDNPKTINFYRKNGFEFLEKTNTTNSKSNTRIMYFDLMPILNFLDESASQEAQKSA